MWIASRSLSSGAHSRDPLAAMTAEASSIRYCFQLQMPPDLHGQA
jgi:hypothetical protein